MSNRPHGWWSAGVPVRTARGPKLKLGFISSFPFTSQIDGYAWVDGVKYFLCPAGFFAHVKLRISTDPTLQIASPGTQPSGRSPVQRQPLNAAPLCLVGGRLGREDGTIADHWSHQQVAMWVLGAPVRFAMVPCQDVRSESQLGTG